MASIPSAGCLLAKNQYYRTRQNSESSVSSSSSWCSDAVNVADQDKAFNGLPELIDKSWWIKSFFHNEPSPPTVGRKTLSASRLMIVMVMHNLSVSSDYFGKLTVLMETINVWHMATEKNMILET